MIQELQSLVESFALAILSKAFIAAILDWSLKKSSTNSGGVQAHLGFFESLDLDEFTHFFSAQELQLPLDRLMTAKCSLICFSKVFNST